MNIQTYAKKTIKYKTTLRKHLIRPTTKSKEIVEWNMLFIQFYLLRLNNVTVHSMLVNSVQCISTKFRPKANIFSWDTHFWQSVLFVYWKTSIKKGISARRRKTSHYLCPQKMHHIVFLNRWKQSTFIPMSFSVKSCNAFYRYFKMVFPLVL